MANASMFEGVIGHQAVLRLLTGWVQNPAPGYLFLGPAHLGKHFIAERFIARLLDCVVGEYAAHPDVVVLEVEEGKTMIAVDAVRRLRLRLAERPLVAQRIVAYIPQIDRLNEEGVNALLKVLEEPPAGATFVCVAQDVLRIPATLLSRFVCLRLAPVSQDEIFQGMLKSGFNEIQAKERADRSRGRPGRALGDEYVLSLSCRDFLKASSCGERLAIIDRLVKDCESTESSVESWKATLDDWEEYFSHQAALSPQLFLVIGQAIATARRFVGGPLSPRLPLEAAAMRLSTNEPLRQLFPTMLSSAYPAIFNF